MRFSGPRGNHFSGKIFQVWTGTFFVGFLASKRFRSSEDSQQKSLRGASRALERIACRAGKNPPATFLLFCKSFLLSGGAESKEQNQRPPLISRELSFSPKMFHRFRPTCPQNSFGLGASGQTKNVAAWDWVVQLAPTSRASLFHQDNVCSGQGPSHLCHLVEDCRLPCCELSGNGLAPRLAARRHSHCRVRLGPRLGGRPVLLAQRPALFVLR